MDKLVQEVRYGLRQLRKSPAFTITAVLTLAFGIGANVAVFSVMNAVLLNPSGLHNPQGLVALRARYTLGGMSNISISAPDFQDALEGRKIFASAAIMQPGSFNYTGADAQPVRLQAARVSWQWFDVFQVKPYLGRAFHLEVPGLGHAEHGGLSGPRRVEIVRHGAALLAGKVHHHPADRV